LFTPDELGLWRFAQGIRHVKNASLWEVLEPVTGWEIWQAERLFFVVKTEIYLKSV
jgi:hypothetical protein